MPSVCSHFSRFFLQSKNTWFKLYRPWEWCDSLAKNFPRAFSRGFQTRKSQIRHVFWMRDLSHKREWEQGNKNHQSEGGGFFISAPTPRRKKHRHEKIHRHGFFVHFLTGTGLFPRSRLSSFIVLFPKYWHQSKAVDLKTVMLWSNGHQHTLKIVILCLKMNLHLFGKKYMFRFGVHAHAV